MDFYIHKSEITDLLECIKKFLGNNHLISLGEE